jgi:hypothetical protein
MRTATCLSLLGTVLAIRSVNAATTGISSPFPVDTRIVRNDSDSDGLPDTYEQAVGLNWHVDDANEDPDGDGSTNLQEYNSGTNPKSADSPQAARRVSSHFALNTGGLEPVVDTDSDGIPDWWELRYALDANTRDSDRDSDLDGKSNLAEYLAGENPRFDDRFVAPLALSRFFEVDTGGKLRDVDSDGLPNWWERLFFGNATIALRANDFDGDRQSNLEEFLAGTDPTDRGSLFGIMEVQPAPFSIVRWSSVSARTYSLWQINLDNFTTEPIASNLLATPPLNSYTNVIPQPRAFYRVSTP